MSAFAWEQKLAALKALTSTHLEMRAPGDWYVSAYDRSCKEGAFLKGSYGNGNTPEQAVEDDWRQISGSPCVVIGGQRETRREVRWNGFMWEDVK